MSMLLPIRLLSFTDHVMTEIHQSMRNIIPCLGLSYDHSINMRYVRCAYACGRPAVLSASPQQSVTDAIIVVSATFQPAILLSMTVDTASEMHSIALCSLTQPCLTACQI